MSDEPEKKPPENTPEPTKKDDPKPDDQKKEHTAFLKREAELKQQLEAQKKELEEFKAQQEEEKRKALEAQNDFKGLYEQEIKKREALELQQEAQKKIQQEQSKISKVQGELEKLGLKSEYKEKIKNFIEHKSVSVDDTNGLVYGHESEAQRIKTAFPDLFGTQQKVIDKGGNIKKDDTMENDGDLTLEAWKKLPYEEKLKRRMELLN